jgi:hypothetical protein
MSLEEGTAQRHLACVSTRTLMRRSGNERADQSAQQRNCHEEGSRHEHNVYERSPDVQQQNKDNQWNWKDPRDDHHDQPDREPVNGIRSLRDVSQGVYLRSSKGSGQKGQPIRGADGSDLTASLFHTGKLSGPAPDVAKGFRFPRQIDGGLRDRTEQANVGRVLGCSKRGLVTKRWRSATFGSCDVARHGWDRVACSFSLLNGRNGSGPANPGAAQPRTVLRPTAQAPSAPSRLLLVSWPCHKVTA